MGIHQITPGLNFGDAIGEESLEIKRIIESWGVESRIYAEFASPQLENTCYPAEQMNSQLTADDILIYHHSIGGTKAFKLFLSAKAKRAWIYHNITPAKFLTVHAEKLAYMAEEGRRELVLLRDNIQLTFADSEYNACELYELGFKSIFILPLPFSPEKLDTKYSAPMLEKFYATAPSSVKTNPDSFAGTDSTNFLFVGRVAPNKCHHDVIRIFDYYQKHLDPVSRLFIVGSYCGFEPYLNSLHQLVQELKTPNIVFAGHTTREELVSYYKMAHIFLCMSEHEGFGVPFMESMHFKVPILAYRSAAVPETVGDAALLLDSKDPKPAAELAFKLVFESTLRNSLIKKGEIRLNEFSLENFGLKLKQAIIKSGYGGIT